MTAEAPSPSRGVFHFGVFELDARSGEVRKRGVLVRLPGQSIQILTALLERPGEVVTREELRNRLWPEGTNVDFDHGLATAVRKLREILGDSAENPRFIETLPRRGYRFLQPVRVGASGPPPVPTPVAAAPHPSPRGLRDVGNFRVLAIAASLAAIALFLIYPFRGHVRPNSVHPDQHIDPKAYGLYQRARYGPRLTRDSIPYFQKAIALEPRFALAHAGLSSTYIQLALHSEISPREVMPLARDEALAALAIDNTNAEAHVDLGTVKATLDWDRSGADREYRRALALDPNVDGGRAAYALFLVHMERFDEAMDQIASLEKGPVGFQTVYANVLYFSRQYQRTIEYCQWALGFAPAADGLQFWLARAYADQSRLTEAIDMMERSRALNPDKPSGFGILASLYSRAGRRPDAVRLLTRMLEVEKTHYVSPVHIAISYIALDDLDRAFAWLDKACLEHDFSLSWLKVDPAFYPIRGDRRFRDLLHRVRLE